tara:strand:- start:5167 stop:5946 length:780 start_codon:yes stop_codon:yes gene_type:complete
MTTNTLYKSNKYSVKTKEDGNRYIHSESPIKIGEVLLIEHCFLSKDLNKIKNAILNSSDIFDNLHPIKEKWSEDLLSTEDVKSLVSEKAEINMVKCEDSYIIGKDISTFTFSKNPNANVRYINYKMDDTLTLLIVYVFAKKEINVNEIITISYENGYFGENVCPDYSVNTTKLQKVIGNIICGYVRTERCIEIIVNQVCIHYGVYIINNMIKSYTDEFKTKFNNEITNENIKKWIQEKKTNYKILLSTWNMVVADVKKS